MGKYVENNLNKNEVIVQKAQLNALYLVKTWVVGILFCWLLLIPLIKAIIATIKHCHIDLAVTNKRVLGKVGVFNTITIDLPLNKIQSVTAVSKLAGKIFNYGTVVVTSAAGEVPFPGIKNANAFKGTVMNQIEEYEEQRMRDQASQMASAMASVINK